MKYTSVMTIPNAYAADQEPLCLAIFEELDDGTLEANYFDDDFEREVVEKGLVRDNKGRRLLPEDGEAFLDWLKKMFQQSTTTDVVESDTPPSGEDDDEDAQHVEKARAFPTTPEGDAAFEDTLTKTE